MALRRQPRQQHPNDPAAAAQVEHTVVGLGLDGIEQHACAVVEPAAREHPFAQRQTKGVAVHGHVDRLGWRRFCFGQMLRPRRGDDMHALAVAERAGRAEDLG